MGFRFRKSIQIVPGVRVNVSRSGIGYSAGIKGARITKHANGRVSRTLSVPGTGLSHQTTIGGQPIPIDEHVRSPPPKSHCRAPATTSTPTSTAGTGDAASPCAGLGA